MQIIRLNSIIQLVFTVAIVSLLSCVASERGLGVFRRSTILKSEKFVKSNIPSKFTIEITQNPTPEKPLLGFKVSQTNPDYIIREYNNFENTEQIITYKPMVTAGWIAGAAGLLYFLTNPSPDTSKYTESKFDDLNAEALANRRTGFGLLAAGIASYFIGKDMPDEKKTVEKPVGVYVEKTARISGTMPSVFTYTIKGYPAYEMWGLISIEGYGFIKADEIMSRFTEVETELPEHVTLEIKLSEGESVLVHWSIEEAVSFMTKGKKDWSKAVPESAPEPKATMELPQSIKLGEQGVIKINVSNKNGKGDCYRLSALITYGDKLFVRNILIGRLKPGEEYSLTETFVIPNELALKEIPVKVEFKEANNNIPAALSAKIQIKEK